MQSFPSCRLRKKDVPYSLLLSIIGGNGSESGSSRAGAICSEKPPGFTRKPCFKLLCSSVNDPSRNSDAKRAHALAKPSITHFSNAASPAGTRLNWLDRDIQFTGGGNLQ